MLERFEEFEKMEKLQLPSTMSQLSDSNKATLIGFYKPLLEEPRPSIVVQTICLYLLDHEAFYQLCEKMVKRSLRKGIPSFFRSIRPLFTLQPYKV